MKTVTSFASGHIEEEDAPSIFIVNFFSEINRITENFVLKSQIQSQQLAQARGDDQQRAMLSGNARSFGDTSPTQRSTSRPQVCDAFPLPSQKIANITQQQSSNIQSQFMPPPNTASRENDSGQYKSPYVPAPSQPQAQHPEDINHQQYLNNFQNDPLAFLDNSQEYTPSPNMDLDPSWINGDDMLMQPELYIPNDGSWFFPFLIP
jgi:hypothetical protein